MVCPVPLSRALLVAGAERGGTRAHSSESESTMGKRGEEREKTNDFRKQDWEGVWWGGWEEGRRTKRKA